MKLANSLTALFLLTGATACVDDEGPGAPEVTIDWQPCAFVTGETILDAECALVALPVDYNDPDGPTIDVSVKRRLVANSTGQFWVLNGGPGGSVTDFEPAIDTFALRDDLDIYMLEHRGVGASSGLFCPTQQAASSPGEHTVIVEEIADCVTHLEATHGSLDAFTTTAAAHDLATLIDETKVEGDEVFIYGVSYGTYWLHRYTQIAPAQADGLIFDSICAPGQCQLGFSFGKGADEVARQILDGCADDATCSARLPNPIPMTEALYADLDNGHCPGLALDKDEIRATLARAIRLRPLQPYLAAVIHRMRRCSVEDVLAVNQMFAFIEANFSQPRLAPASPLLGAHIGMSELYVEATAAELAELDSWLVMANNVALSEDYYNTWPRYTPDAFYDTLTTTKVPALLLQGDFDPQTPPRVATNLRDRLNGPNQTYVEVPFSAHNVIQSSTVDNAVETCGQQLLLQFMTDPTAPLDTGCTSRTLGLNFVGIEQNNQTLFGTDDMWD